MFQWSYKNPTPFSIHVLNPTFNDIVPEDWVLGKLQDQNRRDKLKIRTLVSNIPYSVFAKVEKGRTFNYLINALVLIIQLLKLSRNGKGEA